MECGYLGDVGRRTVMRFGTVDPKRPAVAVYASTKSRLLMARIGSSIVSCTLHTFDPATWMMTAIYDLPDVCMDFDLERL